MSFPQLARLQIVAAALLFSTGGTVIKSCGLTGWQVASFRCGVAALAMLAMMPQARRRWTGRSLPATIWGGYMPGWWSRRAAT